MAKSDNPSGPSYRAVKATFMRNLQAAMIRKGWSQSDMARQAAAFMPNKRFGRDNVSKYLMTGKSGTLPSPIQLNALAQALRMKPDELMPTDKARLLAGRMDDNEFSAESVEDGMRVRLNQVFPEEIGKKIIALVMAGKE